MASKLQFYNMALTNIGMKKIFSTTSATSNPSLEACDLHYLEAITDTYSEYSWSFATVKEQFPVASVDVVGWDYVYPYPPKAASVNAVFSEANVDYKDEQEFEVVFIPSAGKKFVCSDEAEAYIEYTYIVEDTTIFSSKFIAAGAFKLAALIAPALTGDPALAQKMSEYAAVAISEAKRVNFTEKIKRPKRSNAIVDSRG